MGFRNGAYARVWGIKTVSDTITNVNLSISRKNKKTDEYIQDFSGFVDFLGSANAQKALNLRRGDTIKLGDTDVSTSYKKETKQSFTQFKVFSFENVDNSNKPTDAHDSVDSGEVEDTSKDEEPLPF